VALISLVSAKTRLRRKERSETMKLDKHHAADEVAKAINHEVVNGCPHEGWGANICDMEGTIAGAKMKDGKLILRIVFDDHCYDYEQGHFDLTLSPESWERIAPEKGRRKTRAKDLRARQPKGK
jgi:hypothetical protein